MLAIMASREKLTFSQAEGLEPLPAPLRLGELTSELRNTILNVLLLSLNDYVERNIRGVHITGPWRILLLRKHMEFDHRPIDEEDMSANSVVSGLKEFVLEQPYNKVFDLLQFFVREESCPSDLLPALNRAFEEHLAAYRFVGRSIMPVATEQEAATLKRAFADLAADEFGGARAHLRAAGEALTQPNKASDSVRESIHAVEAVVRVLTGKPKATLSDALALLKGKGTMHPAFEAGLQKLYAYTNDEHGIRHALNSEGAAVDEADAIFMLGACASFVTYLIGKSRSGPAVGSGRSAVKPQAAGR